MVHKRLYQQLKGNSRTAAIGNLVISTVVYAVLTTSGVSLAMATLWLLMLLIAAGMRFATTTDSLIPLKLSRSTSDRLRNYTLLSLALGSIWAMLPLFGAESDSMLLRNFIFVIIVGLISSSVATLSSWLPAFLSFVLPMLFSLLGMFIWSWNPLDLYTAAGVVIYGIVMFNIGRISHRNHVNTFELEQKNNQLIGDLNSEIQQRRQVQKLLEKSEQDLEEQVEQRSQALTQTNVELEKEIQERIKTEKTLNHLANYDTLTHLPNRNLLLDRLQVAILNAARDETRVGVLFFDLDRFKGVNDSLGHEIGDQILIEVAQRLRKTLRKKDTIARNGGDEFVVIIDGLNTLEQLNHLAAKLIETIIEPYQIDEHTIYIGSSIGIATYPQDGGDGDTLLRNADTAMYQAKRHGGDSFQYYDVSLSTQVHERVVMESELRSALDKSEFRLVFQPQISTSHGAKIVGYESLLRWKNPKLGSVSPFHFIPILEDSRLIHSVGEWIIEQVIAQIAEGTFGQSKVSINLSAIQCGDPQLIQFIIKRISHHQIDSSQLEFEITESLFIENFSETIQFLDELHQTGCSIALDDFGTGYTSMSYLIRLPIDTIKLDWSFITNIDSRENLRGIVTAITSMSRSLNLENVFEGVETEEELDAIRHMRDEVIVQGYIYSKPLEVEAIPGWVEQWLQHREPH